MTALEQARAALDLHELHLPPSPRIVRIDVEDYVDTDGEDALRVWAILDDAVTDEELLTDAVLDIDTQLREALRGKGVTRWPYVGFVKQSELDEGAAED